MTEDLARRRETLAMEAECLALEEELEAARSNKGNDPETFARLKQEFEEKRTYWRQIGEALKLAQRGLDDGVNTTITLGAVDVGVDTIAPFNGEDA